MAFARQHLAFLGGELLVGEDPVVAELGQPPEPLHRVGGWRGRRGRAAGAGGGAAAPAA